MSISPSYSSANLALYYRASSFTPLMSLLWNLTRPGQPTPLYRTGLPPHSASLFIICSLSLRPYIISIFLLTLYQHTIQFIQIFASTHLSPLPHYTTLINKILFFILNSIYFTVLKPLFTLQSVKGNSLQNKYNTILITM